ncbi:MAG: hypothetical protein G01um101425_134 [Candidatus Peregrinibacteria bacterium Gr01-1014_25]|nr:MAG: hypothetical protein G01um101425_134 [Candidatus Peregrinibacteria bacterium Gr01-1014_25]
MLYSAPAVRGRLAACVVLLLVVDTLLIARAGAGELLERANAGATIHIDVTGDAASTAPFAAALRAVPGVTRVTYMGAARFLDTLTADDPARGLLRDTAAVPNTYAVTLHAATDYPALASFLADPLWAPVLGPSTADAAREAGVVAQDALLLLQGIAAAGSAFAALAAALCVFLLPSLLRFPDALLSARSLREAFVVHRPLVALRAATIQAAALSSLVIALAALILAWLALSFSDASWSALPFATLQRPMLNVAGATALLLLCSPVIAVLGVAVRVLRAPNSP